MKKRHPSYNYTTAEVIPLLYCFCLVVLHCLSRRTTPKYIGVTTAAGRIRIFQAQCIPDEPQCCPSPEWNVGQTVPSGRSELCNHQDEQDEQFDQTGQWNENDNNRSHQTGQVDGGCLTAFFVKHVSAIPRNRKRLCRCERENGQASEWVLRCTYLNCRLGPQRNMEAMSCSTCPKV